MPREVFEFETPPGTYFDLDPLLLVTDATLRSLQRVAPASRIDVRRFRPNFLIETNDVAGGTVSRGGLGGQAAAHRRRHDQRDDRDVRAA